MSLHEHADSASCTLGAVDQLGPAVHAQAVNAVTDVMATRYRDVAVVVLMAAIDHCYTGGSSVPDGREDDGEQDCYKGR